MNRPPYTQWETEAIVTFNTPNVTLQLGTQSDPPAGSVGTQEQLGLMVDTVAPYHAFAFDHVRALCAIILPRCIGDLDPSLSNLRNGSDVGMEGGPMKLCPDDALVRSCPGHDTCGSCTTHFPLSARPLKRVGRWVQSDIMQKPPSTPRLLHGASIAVWWLHPTQTDSAQPSFPPSAEYLPLPSALIPSVVYFLCIPHLLCPPLIIVGSSQLTLTQRLTVPRRESPPPFPRFHRTIWMLVRLNPSPLRIPHTQ